MQRPADCKGFLVQHDKVLMMTIKDGYLIPTKKLSPRNIFSATQRAT